MTTRYERLKMQRRMQRRIRLVVEERRMALALPPPAIDPALDPEETVEIPRQALAQTVAPVERARRAMRGLAALLDEMPALNAAP